MCRDYTTREHSVAMLCVETIPHVNIVGYAMCRDYTTREHSVAMLCVETIPPFMLVHIESPWVGGSDHGLLNHCKYNMIEEVTRKCVRVVKHTD